jgi:hypothetical protein
MKQEEKFRTGTERASQPASQPRFSQKIKNRATLVSKPTCKEEAIIHTSSSQAMASS